MDEKEEKEEERVRKKKQDEKKKRKNRKYSDVVKNDTIEEDDHMHEIFIKKIKNKTDNKVVMDFLKVITKLMTR